MAERTKRHQTGDQLVKDESLCRALLDNISAGVILLDNQCVIRSCNSAAEAILGVPAEQIMGKTYLDLGWSCVREDGSPYPVEEHPSTITLLTGQAFDDASMGIIRDDDTTWIAMGTKPLFRDEENLPYAVVISFWDITRPKKAEEAATLERKQLLSIFDGINEVISVIDSETYEILFVNRFMKNFYGQDLIGSICYKALHNLDSPCPHCTKQIVSAMDGEPYQWDYHNSTTNRDYLATDRIIKWTGGRDAKFHLGIDVTERKKADRELRESEKRFKNLAGLLPQFVFEADYEGFFTFANQAALETSGYTWEDIEKGLHILEVIVPEEAERAGQNLAKLQQGEKLIGQEFLLKTADGLTIPVVFYANPIERDGKVVGIGGVAMDLRESKRAEEKLQREKNKLKGILDHMNDGVYIVNRQYELEYANPIFDRHFGMVDGRRCHEHLDGRDEPCPWCRNEEVFAGRSVQWEWHSRRTGKIYEIFETPIENEDGTLSKLGFFHDITVRKRAEEQVRRNEARLHGLFNISALREASEQELLDFALKTAVYLTESRLGYLCTYDQAKQISAFNRWPEDSTTECRVAPKQYVEDMHRKSIWNEALIRKQPMLVNDFQAPNPFNTGFPEGHVEIDRLMVLPLCAGEPTVAVIGVANKQTDYDEDDVRQLSLLIDSVWRMVEVRRYEEVQKRLVTALDQAAEGVLITDKQGTIEYVNPAVESITGYTGSDLIGKTPKVFKSGEHPEAFYKELWQTILSGNTWSGRMVNRKKDGTLYQEDTTISPVRNAEGEIVNFVAVKHDITEHLALSNQLFQAQKMEAVGRLAGGIAHDFNNLLQVTLGYAELLLAEKTSEDPEYSDLCKIEQAAKSGGELVQRLLMFSRKVEPKAIPLDLNRQIRQIEELLRRTIPKMIEIQLNLDEDLARINADPTQIEQVIVNLAVNARDAMPEGGRLTVLTRNVTLDEEFCKVHVPAKPGRYVMLMVTDSGHGMDKQTIEHIFEPFFTTKELGRGTGLGLAMVYGIVKQHYGHISCSSSPGQGAAFEIFFPAIESEAQAKPAESRIASATGTETILLIDDEDAVRELGRRILAKAGYTVLTAADGVRARDLFRKDRSKIDLVILDLIMPEMGGQECLKELIRIDPRAKVLVASGYATDESVKEATGNGARGFVDKPFRVKDLQRQVRKVIDES